MLVRAAVTGALKTLVPGTAVDQVAEHNCLCLQIADILLLGEIEHE